MPLQLVKDPTLSRESLQQKLMDLVLGRDNEPLSKKVAYYSDILAPIVEELARYSPYPKPEDQIPIMLGVWTPIWSTIPFHDIIPGRIEEQSYQIFSNEGYYANIARYVPSSKIKFLRKLPKPAYDLMILQSFSVSNDQWLIQNVGIKQIFRWNAGLNLTPERAKKWFAKILQAKLSTMVDGESILLEPEFMRLNKKFTKKLQTTYQARPLFEHLYISNDLRVVKTQREAKQRPSYTIAVRVDHL